MFSLRKVRGKRCGPLESPTQSPAASTQTSTGPTTTWPHAITSRHVTVTAQNKQQTPPPKAHRAPPVILTPPSHCTQGREFPTEHNIFSGEPTSQLSGRPKFYYAVGSPLLLSLSLNSLSHWLLKRFQVSNFFYSPSQISLLVLACSSSSHLR